VPSTSPDQPAPRRDSPRLWRLSDRVSIPLDRPVVMGILNVTPDSFSDGGKHENPAAITAAARAMIHAGADLLDLGAESTRPGARRVSATDQLGRLLPAIAAVRAVSETIPLTIDTTLEAVAHAALEHGGDAINDVSAGEDSGDGMLRLAAQRRCGLILMHRKVAPPADSYSDAYATPPQYADVVSEVAEFLRSRADAAIAAGVPAECIALDPGLGFGKSVEQNLALLTRTGELSRDFPIVSGLSRKSFVGRLTLQRDSTPDERLPGTIALSIDHLRAGASIFRVHDVGELRQALDAAHHAAHPGVRPPTPPDAKPRRTAP
jgi:dihydropteroate synthase